MATKPYVSPASDIENQGTRSQIVYAVLLDPATGNAVSALATKQAQRVPKGDQQIAIAAMQTPQQLTVPAGATLAVLQNNSTQALRWRDNGQNPTSTLGMRILAGDDPFTYAGDLAALRLIAEAAGTGTLDVVYYNA